MVAATGDRDLVFWADQGTKIWAGLQVVLPLIIVSYGVGLTIEFIFGLIRGHSLHEGFLVSGMLIPLIMPADVPLWMVAVATAFAVIIGKEVFWRNWNEYRERCLNRTCIFILCLPYVNVR